MSALYPFLDDDTVGPPEELLADLARSAQDKSQLSDRLRAQTVDRLADQLAEVAAEVADRVRSGGRLFAFGNGGSATDAAGLVALFSRPPQGRPVAARCLADDQAVLTALGNDLGFEHVYARQLQAFARAGDVAVGLSTSGQSRNVVAAFEQAARAGLLTVGLAGYDGGAFARCPTLAHCLVVPSESVHRVQEAQNALVYALWQGVQSRLDPAEVPG